MDRGCASGHERGGPGGPPPFTSLVETSVRDHGVKVTATALEMLKLFPQGLPFGSRYQIWK